MEPTLFLCVGSIGVFAVFVVIFLYAAYVRYLRYKETLALAEKGLVRPQTNANGNGKGALRWGIVITALGVALCLGLFPFGWLTARGTFPLNFGPWMVIALIPLCFGLGLILIYVVTSRNGDKQPSVEAVYNQPGDERIDSAALSDIEETKESENHTHLNQ